MAAKAQYTQADLMKLSPTVRAFLFFWVRENEREKNQEFGRMIGAHFTAGDIRAWGTGDKGIYRDEDPIFMPLSLALRPELREGLSRMVGGVRLPSDYKKKANEVVVDMGQVTPKEFIDFVEKRRITKPMPPPDGSIR